MRSTRWTAAALAAGLLTTVLAATAPSQATSPDAATGRPAVGQCRQISLTQVSGQSNSTAPIPCSQRHDVRTILVKNLPAGMTWDNLTSAQIGRLGLTMCFPAMRHALGQNDTVRDRTMYTFFFFEPTAAQRTAGANWIRCDLALWQGKTLAPLPTDRVPALSGARVPTKVARCIGGTHSAPSYVACSTSHRYRATGAFTIARKRFPGKKALIAIGNRRCRSLVSTRAFYFSWKDKTIWNLLHDHTLVCYSKRSN